MGPHRQIEAKLEAPRGAAVPDLTGLPGVASADPGEHDALEAVHWDTAGLRLARARITLRRRTGGPDEGWLLLVPVSADEWLDLRSPLGAEAAGVPADLVAAVAARVREATLAPVMVLRTARSVRRLRDAHGRVLLEVADDAVASGPPDPGGAVVDSWREWDVNLVHGDQDLLARAVKRLRASGGTSPQWTHKLGRALGDRLVVESTGRLDDQVDQHCAGEVLREHLRSRRDLLLARDPRVRRDQPGAAHQMRVTTHQLLFALATFGPLMDRGATDQLRGELGWLAGLLGADRAARVASDRLADLIAQEPADLVLGPIDQRLRASLSAERDATHRRVLEALDSARYFRLLDAIDVVVTAWRPTKAAAGPADKALPVLVRGEWDALVTAFEAASSALPGADRDSHLHAALSACLRVRYAADAVAPAMGGSADKFARAAKELQRLLTDHDDLVEHGALLRRVAVEAAEAGENAFTYGRFHAIEQAGAAYVEKRLAAAWSKVRAPRRRRWMK
ncbi:MAG: CYTH and CHAD domain-containing protein [Cellulomonas sp.]|nr:CYTH and CHAD domain-containing protein [Cellulomonas sp.]